MPRGVKVAVPNPLTRQQTTAFVESFTSEFNKLYKKACLWAAQNAPALMEADNHDLIKATLVLAVERHRSATLSDSQKKLLERLRKEVQ